MKEIFYRCYKNYKCYKYYKISYNSYNTYNTYNSYKRKPLIIQPSRTKDRISEVEHHVAVVLGVEVVLCNRQADGSNRRVIHQRQVANIVQILVRHHSVTQHSIYARTQVHIGK